MKTLIIGFSLVAFGVVGICQPRDVNPYDQFRSSDGMTLSNIYIESFRPLPAPMPMTGDFFKSSTNLEPKVIFVIAPKTTEKSVSVIELLKQSGQLTNVINELFSSGEVCKVRGHAWRSGEKPAADGIVMIPAIYFRGNPPERRHCENCGIHQTKSEEWK